MTDAPTVLAEGLRFPEGPIALPNGNVLLVEIAAGALSVVTPDGSVREVAACGGGPNGAAIGPDGRAYVCNNGGFDAATDPSGHFAALGMPARYEGGSIQAVDLTTGEVEVLYTRCGEHPLMGPNDIVFDASGGFWFTDLGKTWPRHHDHGGLYYARIDGSLIREVVHPLLTPNGVGLSPDGSCVYVSLTDTCRVLAWDVTAPGVVDATRPRGRWVFGWGRNLRFDSMAVDADGHLAIGTLGSRGGITDVAPDGSATLIETGDALTTNVCFGGDDRRTAFITCSASGTLRSLQWPRPGLPLAFGGT